jgi:hypothetical protein
VAALVGVAVTASAVGGWTSTETGSNAAGSHGSGWAIANGARDPAPCSQNAGSRGTIGGSTNGGSSSGGSSYGISSNRDTSSGVGGSPRSASSSGAGGSAAISIGVS